MPTLPEGVTTAWTLTATSFMFFMFIGYSLIEMAQVRPKNQKFVFTRNMILFTVSFITFFLVGYGIAFGAISAGIVGAQSNFVGIFSTDGVYNERQFVYYFATSIIVSIIIAGSMCERTRIEPVIGFVVLQQIIIYPLIICWAWNMQGGWLRNMGFYDRAGTIIIFHIAALGGMVGSVVAGPRYGLFMKHEDQKRIKGGGIEYRKKTLGDLLEEQLDNADEIDELYLRKVRKIIKQDLSENDRYAINVNYMVIGTILVTIGWCIMSAAGNGTSHTLNNFSARYFAANSFLNQVLSGSICGLICFMLKRHIVCGDHQLTPRYDIRSLCNGFLSGIAAVGAGSGVIRPWGALITGIIQAFLYCVTCLILRKIKFDDPLENFAIYCTAGIWSMFSCAFFTPYKGILWGNQASGNLLGIQLLGLVATSAWTLTIAWLYFFSLKRCRVLKLKKPQEILGFDCLEQARQKKINLSELFKYMQEKFPQMKKKGC